MSSFFHKFQVNRQMMRNQKVLGSKILFLGLALIAGQSSLAQTLNCASSTQTAVPKSLRTAVKFYSGHYIYVSSPWGSNLVKPTLTEIEGISSVRGLMKKYYWSELEPTKDNYSGIEMIRQDLASVAAKGKKLAVMIQYKFTAPNPDYQNPMPNYLNQMTGNNYYYPIGGKDGQGEHASGYLAKFANPIVVQRFIKLLSKLKELDTHGALAAIVFPETANGIRADLINMRDYYNGLMQVDRAAACYFLKTPFIQLTNYPIIKDGFNYLENLFVPTYKNFAIGYGGPDVYLNDPDLINGAYSYHPSIDGNLPIGMVVAGKSNFVYDNQDDYVGKLPNGLSVPEAVRRVHRYAVDTLAANFVFWRKERRDDPYYLELLQRLRQESSTSTVYRCPASFSSCKR